MKRLLDASGGVIREFHYDQSTGQQTTRSVMDAEPILDMNHRLRNETSGWSKGGLLKHRAEIPITMYQGWVKEARQQGIFPYMKREFQAFIRRKLDDRDNCKLLTSESKTRFRIGWQ